MTKCLFDKLFRVCNKKQINIISYLITVVLLVACCSTFGIERYADEKIISHSGLFFENQGPIKIITTKWNLVAFFDLSSFRERTKEINGFMESTNSICEHLQEHKISQTNCETNFALIYAAEERKE
ncbi:Envelope fusion protein [Aphis craccivora]|uniref:Envelope fusion protein n=1 Tax=Aphis craccivora TaxID=307492 RepID=A0A6G0Y1J0_APHCR|nr:Envelope fusion protein [Aphis craccivora]